MIRENLIFVGIDLHKEVHFAVILDCWNNKLGEIEFTNKPSDFPKLVRKVNKYCTDGKQAIYGLENAYGYGRNLAKWLLDKGYMVKDVNTSLSHRESKHRAMFKKSDRGNGHLMAKFALGYTKEQNLIFSS